MLRRRENLSNMTNTNTTGDAGSIGIDWQGVH